MALINCKECGKDISDTAKVCINCGAKTERYNETKNRMKKIIIITFVVIVIILFSVVVRRNNPMYQYSREAIKVIENYKEGNINKSEIISELDSISYKAKVKSEENEKKSSTWSLLSVQLSSFSTSIECRNVDSVELNEYIKELKKF